MAAIFAASSKHGVLLLERTADGGRKILISGGGRCNVLPSVLAPERFVTESPAHVMRGMLRSWSLVQQRAFFENDLHQPLALEAETGKLFPASNRARDIRDALVDHARQAGVSIEFSTSMTELEATREGWRVQTNRGPVDAASVVLATGGLSVPTTGSDGTGLRIAEALGHRINELYPALTPLVTEPPVHSALSGVSLPVRLRARRGRHVTETRGGFLFTHRGYSGPSVLDISHVAVRQQENSERAIIRAQWTSLDSRAWEAVFSASTGLVVNTIAEHMPQRLATRLLHEARVPPDRRAADLRRAERLALIDRLTAFELPWTGDGGFAKAEVTGGGVDLREVNPQTLESRRHRGLFLCGEMLDAFGPIGGHNFAWAWATGRLAGRGAAGDSGVASLRGNREPRGVGGVGLQ
jgi:predicted Rossmann fold flavoprotein